VNQAAEKAAEKVAEKVLEKLSESSSSHSVTSSDAKSVLESAKSILSKVSGGSSFMQLSMTAQNKEAITAASTAASQAAANAEMNNEDVHAAQLDAVLHRSAAKRDPQEKLKSLFASIEAAKKAAVFDAPQEDDSNEGW